jgi:hypothetical protein
MAETSSSRAKRLASSDQWRDVSETIVERCGGMCSIAAGFKTD